MIMSGKKCGALARETAEVMGTPFYQIHSRDFPDGEIYVRIPADVAGVDVALFSCMGGNPNRGLLEALLAAYALKENGARNVILAAPYLPYARQDASFKPGEPVSIRLVAKLLEDAVSGIVTVDMHLHRFHDIKDVFGGIAAVNVSAMPLLARYVSSRYGRMPVVAPDDEAEQWARRAAETIGSEYYVLEKERRGDEDVEIRGRGVNANRALIVDDIISTGGTIEGAARLLRERGVEEVYVACTHALLVGDAEAKIFNSGVRDLISTNTVPNPYARVSVAEAVARGLSEIRREK